MALSPCDFEVDFYKIWIETSGVVINHLKTERHAHPLRGVNLSGFFLSNSNLGTKTSGMKSMHFPKNV